MKRSAYIRVANRDLQMASVRYRGLLPACALSDLGWRVKVGSARSAQPEQAALVLAVKPLRHSDAEWVRRAVDAGMPAVLDLCDNVFIDGYGGRGLEVADRFTEIAARGSVVTVPTEALRGIVVSETGIAGDRVIVVPDIVETPALLAKQAALLDPWRPWARMREALTRRPQAHPKTGPVLLWFGNHGAVHGSFGLTDLLLIKDALALASRRHRAELWVVSNHLERFKEIEREMPIKCTYFEWAPKLVDSLLASADVCLVPNSLDPFSATKSPNRAIKALHAKVPVVATPTQAYGDLLGECMWLGDPAEGIDAYLTDPALVRTHLRNARAVLDERYSMAALRSAMGSVVARALGTAKA